MLEGILGNINNTFNTNNQTKNNPLEIKKANNSNSSKTKSITVVKKGEAGYMEAMDKDKDGEVTMEEFNDYCKENGVDDKTKLALLETIQSAKMTKKLQEKMEEAQEEAQEDDETAPSENESKDGIIYAKKGDEKYNEVMDENKNGVITYEEYIKYCQKKKGESSEESSSEATSDTASKIKEAYSKSEPKEEGSKEEISIEAEA